MFAHSPNRAQLLGSVSGTASERIGAGVACRELLSLFVCALAIRGELAEFVAAIGAATLRGLKRHRRCAHGRPGLSGLAFGGRAQEHLIVDAG